MSSSDTYAVQTMGLDNCHSFFKGVALVLSCWRHELNLMILYFNCFLATKLIIACEERASHRKDTPPILFPPYFWMALEPFTIEIRSSTCSWRQNSQNIHVSFLNLAPIDPFFFRVFERKGPKLDYDWRSLSKSNLVRFLNSVYLNGWIWPGLFRKGERFPVFVRKLTPESERASLSSRMISVNSHRPRTYARTKEREFENRRNHPSAAIVQFRI